MRHTSRRFSSKALLTCGFAESEVARVCHDDLHSVHKRSNERDGRQTGVEAQPAAEWLTHPGTRITAPDFCCLGHTQEGLHYPQIGRCPAPAS